MVGRKPSPLMPKKKSSHSGAATAPREKATPPPEEDLRPSRRSAAAAPRFGRGPKPSAPQQQLSTEDKRLMRRRRQRRRTLLRIAIVAAICALGVVVWLNWSVLAPDKVWAWLQDLVGGGTGSYPVDLSGTGARRLEQADRYTVVLTDSHVTYLNASGAEVSRYGCTYSEALVRAEGKYVLVAEQGGYRLQLTTRSKVVREWESEHRLRNVAMNAAGQCALLTDGPQGYAVQVQVLDAEGESLYLRSSNRTVTDVALSADGTTVSMMSVEAVNGSLNTRLEVFSLASADPEPQCIYTVADTLLYRIHYLADGVLAAVGDQSVVLMDTHSGHVTTYVPQGKRVLGYATDGQTMALALRTYGDTAGGEAVILFGDGSVQSRLSFVGEFRHVASGDGRYTLLTDSTVQTFSTNGVGETFSVEADGRQAVYTEGKVVVMGLNRLVAYAVTDKHK